jgi:hypothetical protein
MTARYGFRDRTGPINASERDLERIHTTQQTVPNLPAYVLQGDAQPLRLGGAERGFVACMWNLTREGGIFTGWIEIYAEGGDGVEIVGLFFFFFSPLPMVVGGFLV